EFYFQLFKSKYSELLDLIQVLTFENKDKRLLSYLYNEHEVRGSNTIYITHQQIANDIGSTREVVSRLLKKLENKGHLTLDHKKIVLITDLKQKC
ncbi:MAG: helix-turn-helix domain-containing protein, partial [Bacteroidota bacterium]